MAIVYTEEFLGRCTLGGGVQPLSGQMILLSMLLHVNVLMYIVS